VPTVDFTLEDVRTLVQGELGGLRDELRAEMEDLEFSVNDSFQQLTDQMNAQFAEVKVELKGIRRVTRQHSAAIAELRAVTR
jgi:hypothetical protein